MVQPGQRFCLPFEGGVTRRADGACAQDQSNRSIDIGLTGKVGKGPPGRAKKLPEVVTDLVGPLRVTF
jgi:hypothetical protein